MINTPFPQVYASLQFLNGPLAGNTIPVSTKNISIGSDPGNAIVLSDPSIHPYHAHIHMNQGRFVIQGHGPQCIVIVNQRSVPGAVLSEGDEVALGLSGIRFLWTTTTEQRVQSHAAPENLPPPSQSPAAPMHDFRHSLQSPLASPQNAVTPPRIPSVSAPSAAIPPHVPPTGSMSLPSSETTRYLCAAAHLDEDFRAYAIKNVFEEEHRAVGESYGVDIISVAKWCYAARQRAFYRDLILFIVLLVLLVGSITTGLSSLSSILSPAPSYGLAPFTGLGFLIQPLLTLLITVLVIPTSFTCLFIGVVFRSLRRTFFQLGFLLLLSIAFSFLIPCFLVAWLTTLVEHLISYGPNAALLAKGRFRPGNISWSLDAEMEKKLRDVFDTQDGNVVVYSGYSPFAGAGVNVGGWSFALDISKGKKEVDGTLMSPTAFQVSELYAEIVETIQKLGLSNVSLEDKLYVNGQSIRDDANFLPDKFSRPYPQVAPQLMNFFKENPAEYIRYYKCIRVTSWDGELVLSIFMRFKLAGKNLFVEADYQLLPPVKEEYYEINTIEPTLTPSKFFRFARRTFNSALTFWLRSPIQVFNYVFHDQFLARRRARIEASINENPAFDYGTSTSLREVASSSKYRLYFQRLDKEMYVKIIERQLLDSLIGFLDARNIDTSDLKSREDHILNNGVIVSGGTFSAENIAVGERASATSTKPTASPAEGRSSV